MTPEQCRAARALLDWSQDDLERQSSVAKKTIADFERGVQIPYERTLVQLSETFEVNGVSLIGANGGGVGVRMKQAVPTLKRKRISRFDELAAFSMAYRGADYRVTLDATILDDIERASHMDQRELDKAFEKHLHKIMLRAVAAIESGRAQSDGTVALTVEDFPEA